MVRMVLLKQVVFDGRILSPGTAITVQDARALERRGVARRLTGDEINDTLEEYTREADRIFHGIEPEREQGSLPWKEKK